MRRSFAVLTTALLLAAPLAATAQESGRCANGKSKAAATWLSIAHPGIGEWYLNDWGNFNQNCPQKRFWLGFIPFYGWPGYLQVKSAIDANNCTVRDTL